MKFSSAQEKITHCMGVYTFINRQTHLPDVFLANIRVMLGLLLCFQPTIISSLPSNFNETFSG